MRVRLVDPSAYTPPYDHALATALAAAGAEVTLSTSAFPYGEVPEPDGYAVEHAFYRRAVGPAGSRLRRAAKLAQHVPDMRRERQAARGADVTHFQWLPVPQVDGRLLPAGPTVLTAHDVLPREAGAAQRRAQARLYDRVDAVVVHSAHGRARLVDELGIDPAKVHLVPHGAFTHLADLEPAGLPGPLAAVKRPVILFLGLLRPYKGVDVLIDAYVRLTREHTTGAGPPAELWIVGLPKMDTAPLKAAAADAQGEVRFVERFVADEEVVALLRRADLMALPYREIDQSGVLSTALALGVPLVLSDVGGFPEVAARGAASTVPAGDPAALAAELARLLADRGGRRALGARAAGLARDELAWNAVANEHLAIYRGVREASSA